jgi:hypothetical protein
MGLIRLLVFVFLFCFSTVLFACYESTILKPAPFLGNDGEIVRLSDGTIWEVHASYNYLYQYYPSVIVCPERNIIIVEDKEIFVERLK